MQDNKIDIKENYILHLDSQLLSILLLDHSSGKKIIWATDNYSSRGYGYQSSDYIDIQYVTGKNGSIIKPRIEKSKKEQTTRIREKAEVFTPSWICNAQNNLIDEAWFGRPNVFNTEKDKTWETVVELIKFPSEKNWRNYVKENLLEIACGEAPYLVSRYDTVTGEIIPVYNRIGLLDRKLRIVNENTDTETKWIEWTKQAYKSVYGYEWQGDNVLLARENLLFTFADYYTKRFYSEPSAELLKEIAEIISWNIWQMDGLKYVIPNSCKPMPKMQMSIFEDEPLDECEGCKNNDITKHTGIYCKIKDWEKNRTIKFVSLLERGRK